MLALQEPDQLLDPLGVARLVDHPDARPRAALDMEEQARALVGLLHVQRARPELKEPLKVFDRLAQRLRVGVRTEVARAVLGGMPRGVDAGKALLLADLEIEVLLIVPELDVVAG